MSDLFNTGIRPTIDAHIAKLAEEERDYGDYWSASSAGKCYRLQVLTRLGVPPSPEMQENRAIRQRTFSAGHIFHDWIQGITKEAGLSIAQELELQDEDLMIRGHIDDLVLVPTGKFKIEGITADEIADAWNTEGKGTEPEYKDVTATPKHHLILYDYKTVHSDYFHYAREKIGYYHKMQLGTYMYMLRKTTDTRLWDKGVPQLTEARRLNISKDDLRMSENQLLWSDELEKEVLDYWEGLNKVWKSRKMPPCTCHVHDKNREGIGFMAVRSKKGKIFNDYFYEEVPCNLAWYAKFKEEQKNVVQARTNKEF